MKDVGRLTRAIASGDPEAFARLYEAKFDFVYQRVRRITGMEENACLDVVQDVMIRVIRGIKPLDDLRALEGWLVRVARNAAFDHFRKERRRRVRELAAMNGRSTVVQEEVERLHERTDWLRRELAGLDRVAADILELRFRAGLTLKSIGEQLGLSPSAVHGRLLRSIAKLRRRSREVDHE